MITWCPRESLRRSRVRTRHALAIDCSAILMRPWTTRLSVCRYNQRKIHYKNNRKNVGRRAVKHGPAGRQNMLHVDWKNGGFWLDCRFILTWHAAGRVGGCDDWRKEERKVANTSELQTRRFCVASVCSTVSAFIDGWPFSVSGLCRCSCWLDATEANYNELKCWAQAKWANQPLRSVDFHNTGIRIESVKKM